MEKVIFTTHLSKQIYRPSDILFSHFMISNTYIFGLLLLAVGSVCIYYLRKWNYDKLNAEEKKTIEAIGQSSGYKWSWIIFCCAINIPAIITKEFGLFDQRYAYSIIFCFVAIFFIIQNKKMRRELLLAGISTNYQQTDAFINNLFSILFVAVGMIFLLT